MQVRNNLPFELYLHNCASTNQLKMDKFSYLSTAESDFIVQLYNQYLEDPSKVEPGWQRFFEGFEFARQNYDTKSEQLTVPSEFK